MCSLSTVINRLHCSHCFYRDMFVYIFVRKNGFASLFERVSQVETSTNIMEPRARFMRAASQRKMRHSVSNLMNLCCVCGGVARFGIKKPIKPHGVTSCESCARFYSRWLGRGHQLECLLTQQQIGGCKITRKNRSECRYCRLQRCEDVEMVYNPRPIEIVDVEAV